MNAIHEYLVRSRDTIQAALDDPSFAIAITDIVEAIANALNHGRKLLLAGNGGSAADAQHPAGEIVSRMNYDRALAAALALTTDSSVITAIGNDYGYDSVFERQILGLGCPGDVFIAISTSEHPQGNRGGAATDEHCRPDGQDRRRDVVALRSLPARAFRFDTADPADSHNSRAHHLRACRGALVPARRTVTMSAERC